ncbi:MAG: hypothetical protein ACK56I_00275, partial [bacterium]
REASARPARLRARHNGRRTHCRAGGPGDRGMGVAHPGTVGRKPQAGNHPVDDGGGRVDTAGDQVRPGDPRRVAHHHGGCGVGRGHRAHGEVGEGPHGIGRLGGGLRP